MWLAIGVGVLTTAACLAVQAVAIAYVVRTLAALTRRGYLGRGLGTAVAVLQVAAVLLFGSILAQIAVWAAVLWLCGEFPNYGPAFYHSAVNYTTLGYGDIVMSERWRVLGPLEAANGILMGGLATAVLFAALNHVAGERRGRRDDPGDT